LASDIRKGETQQSVQQLEALLRQDAPLAQVDQLCRGNANLEDLNELVDEFLDEQDRTVVGLITETTTSKRSAERRNMMADFLIGMVAAACECKTLDTANMSLREAVQFLASDLTEPRHFEALLARLRMFNREEVAPVLVETLKRERRTYGSVWVAKAMGQLGWSTFIDPLTDTMCKDCGDFLCEAANEALIRTGESAQGHLIQHWHGLDSSQRSYGLCVIEVVGGEPAASLAFDRYDELFQDDPEHWCQLALSVPEPRSLQLLEQHLPRQQRLFDETFCRLVRLLGVAHPDLELIAERVQKAQADMQARRAAIQAGDWFNPTLILELKCPECGDSNEYEVRHVAINPGSKDTNLMLADEFPCASCSRWVDFEFTSGAHLAISAELLRLTTDSEKGVAGQSKVPSMVEALYNGQQSPVSEVVSRCRAAVATNPERIVDWLRLGFCYHQVLARPRHGLDHAERALVLEPNAVEAVVQKADAMAMQGDEAAAFQLLDQAFTSKEHWRFFLTDVASPALPSLQPGSLDYTMNWSEVLAGATAQVCTPRFLTQARRWGAMIPVPVAAVRSIKSAASQPTDPGCGR
jgi:hypothetical protein